MASPTRQITLLLQVFILPQFLIFKLDKISGTPQRRMD